MPVKSNIRSPTRRVSRVPTSGAPRLSLPSGYLFRARQDGIDTIGISPKRYTRAALTGITGLYHVSPTGTKTSGTSTIGDWSNANCYALPSLVAAINPGAGTHEVKILAGTYTDYLTISSTTNWAGSTWSGYKSDGITPADDNEVLIVSTGAQHGINIGQANVTINNLSSVAQNVSKDALAITAAGAIVNGGKYAGQGRYAFISSGATGWTINRATFYGAPGYLVNIITGTVNGVFNFCIFSASQSYLCGNTMFYGVHSGGTIYINNCIFVGGQGASMIYQHGAGTTIVNNSIVFGSVSPDAYTVIRDAGALTFNNSYIGYNWYTTRKRISGTVTENNPLSTANSVGITQNMYPGLIIPCVDDYYSYQTVLDLEPIFSARGLKGTWYVDTDAATASAETRAVVEGVRDRGIFEIGVHAKTHSALNRLSTDVVFSITKAGATIAIDRAANTITVTPGGAVAGFKGKTLDAIKTELQALGCTVGSYLDTNQKGIARGEIIANVSGASPQNALYLIDATAATGLFKAEVADAYSDMVSVFGITPKSFATPYGVTSVDLEAAALAAGFETNRISKGEARAEINLANIDLAQLSYLPNDSYLHGTTDDLTRANVNAVVDMCLSKPCIFYLLGHLVAEFSIADWTIVADILATHPGVCVSSAEASFLIKNSGLWATVDGRTYTRTFSDQSNYRLKSSSACVGAGTDPFTSGQGDQYDADGYKVWDDATNLPDGHWIDGVDIGAYAYGGVDKVYTNLIYSGGVYKWPSAPLIIAITGVNNAVYNVDGTGKEFATAELALAAMASLEDGVRLVGGTKGAAIWNRDLSAAEAARANKVLD